ncbi:hypothetical protein [Streptomyces sp. NPDC057966]|uniref:hypothetical protein n=1 Tax=Streptomyces sp. NPDC057966 TaxID=3346292 RepID=UPI0036E020A8
MSLSHEFSRVHRDLMDGRVRLSRIGAVAAGTSVSLPWLVVDDVGREVEPVSSYLRDRLLGDVSPLTCRRYAYDLLRWFRVLLGMDSYPPVTGTYPSTPRLPLLTADEARGAVRLLRHFADNSAEGQKAGGPGGGSRPPAACGVTRLVR